MSERESFLAHYADRLLVKFEGRQESVDSFIVTARQAMRDQRRVWAWDTDTARAAWRAIGRKERMTWTGLCGLQG